MTQKIFQTCSSICPLNLQLAGNIMLATQCYAALVCIRHKRTSIKPLTGHTAIERRNNFQPFPDKIWKKTPYHFHVPKSSHNNPLCWRQLSARIKIILLTTGKMYGYGYYLFHISTIRLAVIKITPKVKI